MYLAERLNVSVFTSEACSWADEHFSTRRSSGLESTCIRRDPKASLRVIVYFDAFDEGQIPALMQPRVGAISVTGVEPIMSKQIMAPSFSILPAKTINTLSRASR